MAEPYYPPNARSGTTQVITFAAAGDPKQLPSIKVPEGIPLLVKGHPNNGGFIYVGFYGTAAGSPAQAWPLTRNEPLTLRVKNASELWAAAQVAGESLCLIVEQSPSP